MKRALLIRHSSSETLANNYSSVLKEQGFDIESLNLFEAAPKYNRFCAPKLPDIDMIIVLGGPLSANDHYTALYKEQEYITKALSINKPIFGVCLGAQLLAKVLGATVEPTGGYQFGLRKIFITSEGASDSVFSKITIPLVPMLHGDCFSYPPRSQLLSEGIILLRNGCYKRINTAFRYKNSYGFQFEPQLTLEEFQVWNRNLFDDYKLMGNDFNPKIESARNAREFAPFSLHHETQMRELLLAFLENANLIDIE
ncbi:MAG: type 1 glutamine amidotransferase [SAR202 cluster bacterium]|jgi:GMP synthase-like glutamine amidotransferase|nr:type 1 glutamine amidotransferase [SAR202 cluster bacterium]